MKHRWLELDSPGDWEDRILSTDEAASALGAGSLAFPFALLVLGVVVAAAASLAEKMAERRRRRRDRENLLGRLK